MGTPESYELRYADGRRLGWCASREEAVRMAQQFRSQGRDLRVIDARDGRQVYPEPQAVRA